MAERSPINYLKLKRSSLGAAVRWPYALLFLIFPSIVIGYNSHVCNVNFMYERRRAQSYHPPISQIAPSLKGIMRSSSPTSTAPTSTGVHKFTLIPEDKQRLLVDLDAIGRVESFTSDVSLHVDLPHYSGKEDETARQMAVRGDRKSSRSWRTTNLQDTPDHSQRENAGLAGQVWGRYYGAQGGTSDGYAGRRRES
jgi:hypothetical protein